ncbi:MAG TPA: MFS transporter [Candidatus Limnocylindrales bacterium]
MSGQRGPGLARHLAGHVVSPLLHERDFRHFWLGQTISVFGDQVTQLGVPLVAVLVLGADATQMGTLLAVGLLPHLLFSLPAGVWLDRVRHRRRLMIAADIARALLIASIPVASIAHVLSMPQLYVVGFLTGSMAVVFDISWNTLLVAVVRREAFVQANALFSGSRALAFVGGPPLAGVLVQILTAPIALVADALSFLGSALFLGRIHAEEPPIEVAEESLRSRLSTGLLFIFRDSIMRPILLSAATINLFNFCFQALFILYVTTRLGVGPGVLGAALGAGAVGGVLGAVIASRVGRRLGLGGAYTLGCILFPVPIVLVPLVTGPSEAVIAMLFAVEFLAGLGVQILDINVGAVIAARTPDAIRSRAGGAFRFINYGIRPVGAFLGGLLGGAIGVRETLFVVTIAASLGVLWLVGSPIPRLRDLPEAAQLGSVPAPGGSA